MENKVENKEKFIVLGGEGVKQNLFKSLPFGFLQMFAKDDGADDDDKNDKDDDKDSDDDKGDKDGDSSNSQSDSNKDDDRGDDKNDSDKDIADKVKKFTQEEVNAIAAKESKKAQDSFLKKLGVKDFKTVKEGFDKLKEIQDANKTEAEKQADKLKELEDEKSTTLSENQKLKAELSAVKAGVKADSLDDVVTLANNLVNEKTDMDAAIKKVIEKYPHFKGADDTNDDDADGSNKNKKPKFSQGDHKTGDKKTTAEQWGEAFKWNG